MYLSKVLKVLYSPRKTLKEIIQEPKYIGPILIILLLIAANIATSYIVFSKEYYEQTLPNGALKDQWTENSTFWVANQNVTVTLSNDSIAGNNVNSYYGSSSIEFSAQNSSQISMQLSGIGDVNCTAPDGYGLLSFRVKWASPTENPVNLTIQAFSANSSSNGFYSDLTNTFSNASYAIWNNLTVPIGSNSTGWTSIGEGANWSTITGLQLQFTWPQASNITLRIDGLFFRGPYQSLLTAFGTFYPLTYGIPASTQFVITWLVLTGMIYVLIKAFKGTITWKPLFVATGFILMTLFIGALISGIGYATLPRLNYPFELYGGLPGEGQAALNSINTQATLATAIGYFGQFLVWAWTAILAIAAVHTLTETSWQKSILIGVLAYTITLVIVSVL